MSLRRLPGILLALCPQRSRPAGQSLKCFRARVGGGVPGPRVAVAVALLGKHHVWWRAVRKASLATADMAFSYDINFF